MPAKSSQSNYGTVALTIHWLTALLILALFVLGFNAASTLDPTLKLQLLSFHVPLGWLVFLLTLGRIAWWVFADKKPNPVESSPAWQKLTAKIVHILLYVVIIGTFASGSATIITSGAVEAFMSGSPEALPNFQDFAARQFHGIGARVMLALLAAHIGAALYHQFIKRDGLLGRMWFQR